MFDDYSIDEWVEALSVFGKKYDIELSLCDGIQEEAPGLGEPVLIMRYTTEQPEGIAA